MTGGAVRQRLAEISDRADAATEGPWKAEYDGGLSERLDIVYVLGPGRALLAVTQTMDNASEGKPFEDAAFIGAARQDIPQLVAALTTVLDLHRPEKRYQPWEACDHSWDTAQEAADAGCVELAEVSHFEVCGQCGDIEMADENDRDYRESLWPCPTFRAVAAVLQDRQ